MRARCFVPFAFVALFGWTLSASALQKVGDTLEARIESPHPVEGGFWRQEIRVPGAVWVKLHVARLALGAGDELLVLDGKGRTTFQQDGPFDGGLWLPSVDGEALTLEIWTSAGRAPWGALVDQVGRGTAPAAPVPESICGTNDMQDAACYQSDAGKWTAGDAVGRMLFESGGGWYLCTGFLVSPYSHFLTCNHCITSDADAQTLEVFWRYQNSQCGGGTLGTDSTSIGAHLVATSETLDYSLVVFSGDTPAQRYGYLTLNTGVPAVGTTMWIAEHPGGGPKKFAVNSDLDGGLAKVDAVGLIGGNGTVTGGASDLGYYADTEGGSSGSAVMESAGDTVIAIHHFGTTGSCDSADMNQGVEMALVYPQIAPYLTSAPLAVQASADKTSGAPPLAVNFTGGATGGTTPYTYDWTFGDGSAHAATQNASHTYTSSGTYSASLTVKDAASATATKSISIVVGSGQALAIAAAADTYSGAPPLTVHFGGTAVGGTAPYNFLWDFGDGTPPSSTQNPVHTYAGAGSFNVTLTVTDSGGASLTDSHITITVIQPPVITSVTKTTGVTDFRLTVLGANFHAGCTVLIDGVQVPTTTFKNSGKVIAKKGPPLKAMCPKGVTVQVTVRNNDDGGVSSPGPYTRAASSGTLSSDRPLSLGTAKAVTPQTDLPAGGN